MEVSCTAFLCLFLTGFTIAQPLVTLQHGGQLRGKSFDFDGQTIDLFLGVRYAAAPTGPRRFQKPSPPESWKGTIDAVSTTNACIQFNYLNPEKVLGDEDCLFMDITVPGGVDQANKKAVMVFIHGGGYIFGSKDIYLGASLAKHGDVIVVAINYRLDALGFLYDGPGTGNFGLWDQRAALVWIQDNIQRFGGDPELVTIFGQSAGSGSVSAQLMGQHNDGLFKRGIQESGSLYDDWGWYTSEREWKGLVQGIKQKRNCPSSMSVYDCLAGLSVKEVYAVLPVNNIFSNIWHPMPDNDFFSPDVVNDSYELSKRFDLLGGFNKQEGADSALIPTALNLTQESIANGLSENYVDIALEFTCSSINRLSVNLCKDFFTKAYGLDSASNDTERGIRFSFLMGELYFNGDLVRQLKAHSLGPKATYAYYFVQPLPSSSSFAVPSWLKVSARHGEELPFVFGYVYAQENNIWEGYFGPKLTAEAEVTISAINRTTAEDKPLTDAMMTMWSNFAKTGNPNKPNSFPSGVPAWPEFDSQTNMFMELGRTSRVVTTPHKERLEQLIRTVFKARQAQVLADKDTECSEKRPITRPADAVVG